ncbi:DUF692 family multinuclear iron-containing protein [Mesorhizobium sp. IMUNJ 23232]|uniref:MNIO family bufferin maturase n=1 Tax=Mesorhizobium sp. IMUNJ 23232 TaxID=3376064 RepID=UPI0037A927A1
MSDIFPSLTIPKAAGIGLRSRHIAEMLARRPAAGWLEVHAENYMGESAQVSALEKLRETYALSVHGVGLSLGSAGGLDADHLGRLRKVCQRFQPDLVSEHLAWSVADGAYLNDLLPLRYDDQALAIVAHNIDRLQETLKRRVLIENLSAYIAFAGSTMTEAEFLAGLVKRTGCGLLLDVNNVFVSAHNLGFNAADFMATLPAEAVGEIHLAGHAINHVGEDTILIDDHGSRVPAAVWSLYADALKTIGPRPTLIEWDTEVPELDVLLGEAMWADMLSASIAFGRRTGAAPSKPDSRFSSVVVPFERRPNRGRMPALAAFEALRPAPVTNPQTGSRRHAVA